MLLHVQSLKAVVIYVLLGVSSPAPFAEYWKNVVPRRLLQQLTWALRVVHITEI